MSIKLKRMLYPLMSIGLMAPLGAQIVPNTVANASHRPNRLVGNRSGRASKTATISRIRRYNQWIINSGMLNDPDSVDSQLVPAFVKGLSTAQEDAISAGKVAKGLTKTQKSELIQIGITNQATASHNASALNHRHTQNLRVPRSARLTRVQIHELRNDKPIRHLSRRSQGVLAAYGIPVKNNQAVLKTTGAYNKQAIVAPKAPKRRAKAKAAVNNNGQNGVDLANAKGNWAEVDKIIPLLNESNLSPSLKRRAKRVIGQLMNGNSKARNQVNGLLNAANNSEIKPASSKVHMTKISPKQAKKDVASTPKKNKGNVHLDHAYFTNSDSNSKAPASTTPVNGLDGNGNVTKGTKIPSKVVVSNTNNKGKTKQNTVTGSNYKKMLNDRNALASKGAQFKNGRSDVIPTKQIKYTFGDSSANSVAGSQEASDIAYLQSVTNSVASDMTSLDNESSVEESSIISADNDIIGRMANILSQAKGEEASKGALSKSAAKSAITTPSSASTKSKVAKNASSINSDANSLKSAISSNKKANSVAKTSDTIAPKVASATAKDQKSAVKSGASSIADNTPGLTNSAKTKVASYLASNSSALVNPKSAIKNAPSSTANALKKFYNLAQVPTKSGAMDGASANNKQDASNASDGFGNNASDSNASSSSVPASDASSASEANSSASSDVSSVDSSTANTPENSAMNSVNSSVNNADNASDNDIVTPSGTSASSSSNNASANSDDESNPNLAELNPEELQALHDDYEALAETEANQDQNQDHSAHITKLITLKGRALNVPHIANGKYSLFNNPEDTPGANEILGGDQLHDMTNKDDTFAKTFMVFQVAKTSDGNTYYHVISYDAKYMGWINKAGMERIGLSHVKAMPKGQYHKVTKNVKRASDNGLNPAYVSKYTDLAQMILDNSNGIASKLKINRNGLDSNLVNLYSKDRMNNSSTNSADKSAAKKIQTFMQYNLDMPQYIDSENSQTKDGTTD